MTNFSFKIRNKSFKCAFFIYKVTHLCVIISDLFVLNRVNIIKFGNQTIPEIFNEGNNFTKTALISIILHHLEEALEHSMMFLFALNLVECISGFLKTTEKVFLLFFNLDELSTSSDKFVKDSNCFVATINWFFKSWDKINVGIMISFTCFLYCFLCILVRLEVLLILTKRFFSTFNIITPGLNIEFLCWHFSLLLANDIIKVDDHRIVGGFPGIHHSSFTSSSVI